MTMLARHWATVTAIGHIVWATAAFVWVLFGLVSLAGLMFWGAAVSDLRFQALVLGMLLLILTRPQTEWVDADEPDAGERDDPPVSATIHTIDRRAA